MALVEGQSDTARIEEARRILLDGLTGGQQAAVQSDKSRLLIVARAGSGKTEVMARRIAWWIAVEGIPKDTIVAFRSLSGRRERRTGPAAPGESAPWRGRAAPRRPPLAYTTPNDRGADHG
jgi:hypothetical protein